MEEQEETPLQRARKRAAELRKAGWERRPDAPGMWQHTTAEHAGTRHVLVHKKETGVLLCNSLKQNSSRCKEAEGWSTWSGWWKPLNKA